MVAAPVLDPRHDEEAKRMRQAAENIRQLPVGSMARDAIISNLSGAIKATEGLRTWIDDMVRIMADERRAIATFPPYKRREWAARLASAFGCRIVWEEGS